MKKIISLLLLVLLFGCNAPKTIVVPEPLFKIIKTSQEQGGTFKFYETITEKSEFAMLTSDQDLKDLISPSDIATCNFALINLGGKPESGYSINVALVQETADKIMLKITEIAPATDNEDGSNPLFIIKVNSKKTLELQ